MVNVYDQCHKSERVHTLYLMGHMDFNKAPAARADGQITAKQKIRRRSAAKCKASYENIGRDELVKPKDKVIS